jgi:hypothetical protein
MIPSHHPDATANTTPRSAMLSQGHVIVGKMENVLIRILSLNMSEFDSGRAILPATIQLIIQTLSKRPSFYIKTLHLIA